jgi:hypothetical protein
MKPFVYVLIAFLSASIYFSIAVLLLNVSLVHETLSGTMSLAYKITLLSELVVGSWQSLTHTDFFLLFLTALLVGANIAVSVLLMQRVQKLGKVVLAAGSGSMLGIISVGCATCGLSVLSLFGLSGVIALIPFGGTGLYMVAIVLLSASLYYNLTQLKKPLVCKSKNS